MPTSGHLRAPRKLLPTDDRSIFRSGVRELDDWFRHFAHQNQRALNAVTYVALLDERIVGYYALCAARLAVDQRAKGRGLGAALFRDAIARAARTSQTLGIACLLVHARDESARAFYLHNADLLASPVDPLHLILPLRAVRELTS